MRSNVMRQLVIAGVLVLCTAATPPVARADVAAPQTATVSVAAADLNGDGAIDLATVVGGRVHLTLSHRGAVEVPGARHVTRVAAADVDGDGDTDLVAATRHGALRVFRNDGTGRLSRARPRRQSTDLANSSNGTLTGRSTEDLATVAPPRITAPATIARIGAFPVLERAGPGTQHHVAIRLTHIPPRSPRAPPFAA
jgi:hypothetical protein